MTSSTASRSITITEMMTGLVASLRTRGIQTLHPYLPTMYRAFGAAYVRLRDIMAEQDVTMGFFLVLDSPDFADVVLDAWEHAIDLGMITKHDTMTGACGVRLDAEEARILLADLPGGAEAFEQVTNEYLRVARW